MTDAPARPRLRHAATAAALACLAGCGSAPQPPAPTGTPTAAPTPATPAPPDQAGVLWRGDGFCAREALRAGVGRCDRADAWDVSACVESPSGGRPWSLRTARSGNAEVGRFEVRKGDQGADGGGDRCELVQQTRPITGMEPAPGRSPMPGGEVRVFSFETLYDESLQIPTNLQYQTLGQWHNSTAGGGCPTSSPLKIAVAGPSGAKRVQVHAQECRKGVREPPRVLFAAPLETGDWHRWRFEIKWSPDPGEGYVRLAYDGKTIVPDGCPADGRCPMATQYSQADGTVIRNHFKLGNYRDPGIEQPTVVSYRRVSITLP